MKKVIFSILFFVVGFSCFAQNNLSKAFVHIIPQPVSVEVQQGHFKLNHSTSIVVRNEQVKGVAEMMQDLLNTPTGYHIKIIKVRSQDERNAIILKLNETYIPSIGDAGYTLQATPQRVVITANDPRGLFYGIQTLMQLLPPDIESPKVAYGKKWEIPCVHILDYPRFRWRGLMLDVSRHFYTVKEVEAYINEMAKYKFNIFHWHLTDDEGWRIQIKGLPRLTEVGAWRVKRTGRWGTFGAPQAGEEATDGGFYTQQEIRDVVRYAKKRFITILPEIDVPAHSLALIAAYPNLSSIQIPYPVWPQSPPHSVDNVLDVANDSTWLVLDKIFTQVAELFPGPYIHVGGDEANRSFWMKDPKDLALMKKEGITTAAGLQSYFERKLEKIIVSKGKKMIGWDEILEGGIAPEATVMSWRGMQGSIKAAKMGHDVIMTPTTYCYLDYYQGDPLIEPPTAGTLKLSTCYKLEPVPEGVDSTYILGGQGNLWCERVSNFRHAEYMTWPRAMALAEVFWSSRNKRNWKDFLTREQDRFKYMDVAQIKYSRSQYDAIITGVKGANDSLKVKLSTQMPGLDIYYRFDETNPDNFSPKYEGDPLVIPKGASEIKVITYMNGKPVGNQINCPLEVVSRRVQNK